MENTVPIVIPSSNDIDLLTKHKNVMSTKKDLNLRFTDVNNRWLRWGNFKSKDEALGLTDKECLWSKFADIYEQHDKDVLAGKAYGILQPIIIENNRYTWTHAYRWPSYDSDNNIIGINALGYEISNHSVIDALHLLTNKNRLGLKEYRIDKPINDILTTREKEIIFYLCHGKTAKKIALLLNISYRTVEVHINNIKFKLKCYNKEQIIEYAVNNHYVSILPGCFLGTLAKSCIKTGFYQFLSGLLD